MKKLNKILGIILAILGVALIVLYVIFPIQFKECFEYAYGLLNEPLPIVGVSLFAILFFVWKIVKYIRDIKPHEEIAKMREEHEKYVVSSNKEKQEILEQNKELKGYIAHICELSTNQKIKNFGKELLGYDEKTVDNKPKEE